MPAVVLTPSEIEARAEAAGLSVAELCAAAGIALSTFYRWRRGTTTVGLAVYGRLLAASESKASPETV